MTQHATRYMLHVWITVPHDREDDEPEESGREVEKRLFRILSSKTDFNADCELMETERIEETVPDPPDEDYERAAAKARGNDFAETGGKDWT